MRANVRTTWVLLASFAAGFGLAAVVRQGVALTGAAESSPAETGASPAIATVSRARRRPSPEALRVAERHFQAAYAAYQNGRHTDAMALAEKASTSDATDPRPHHLRGKIYQAMYLPEEAEDAFRAAIESDPSFVESKKELSVVLHDTGRYRAAVEWLEPLVSRHPENHLLRGELAVNLLKLGEAARALVLLREYRRAVGDRDAWVRMQLGRALAELDQNDEAETELREALRLDPTLSVAYFELGQLLAASGREEASRPLLERYRRLRELESSDHQIRMSLMSDPQNLRWLTSLAQVQFQRGRFRESLKTLERALEIAPGDPDLQRHHANVSRRLEGRE